MKKTIKKSSNEKKSGALKTKMIGASLAGLAATAYFFLGPEGKKHQKNTKVWALKMKGDVVDKLEKAKVVTEPAYHKIIDSVAAKHGKEIAAGREEINELANDLKKHWEAISALAMAMKKDNVKEPVKVAKKTAMKTKNNSSKIKKMVKTKKPVLAKKIIKK